MTDENRQLYESQTNALYAAFGKFAVSFEAMCDKIVGAITTFLHSGGLAPGNSRMADALLAGQTADPLLRIMTSFLAMVFPDEADKKIIAKYAKAVRDLIEYRNSTVHRFWDIGYACVDATDFSVAGGYKVVNTAEGPDFRYTKSTASDFLVYASKAAHLEKVTFDMSCIHRMGRTLASRYSINSKEFGIDIILPDNI